MILFGLMLCTSGPLGWQYYPHGFKRQFCPCSSARPSWPQDSRQFHHHVSSRQSHPQVPVEWSHYQSFRWRPSGFLKSRWFSWWSFLVILILSGSSSFFLKNREHFLNQIILSYDPFKSKKFNRFASFCPVSISFSSNWQYFCGITPFFTEW